MTYAALVSLLHTVDHILDQDQYLISPREVQYVTSIHNHTIFLISILKDFPEEVNTFEARIRDVANEAELVIEYFTWGQIQSQNASVKLNIRGDKVHFENRNLGGKYTNISYDLKGIEKLTREFDSISRETMSIKNNIRMKEVRLGGGDDSSLSRSYSAPSQKKDAMTCFVDHLLAIKERLCGQSSKLQFIPIVGMGGIGKTTLARNAYLDQLVIESFDVRAWVTVSQDCSTQKIIHDLLITSMKEMNTTIFGQSDEEKLYKSLKGRRYLIVMDDMWSTKAWDDVSRIFPDDDNGSRIMLTTRLLDVASYVDSSSDLHEMCFMDKDESWNLLRQKVFGNQDCPSELEAIGKKIAKSCGGLPLAIVVIGGLLRTLSKTRASWGQIAENVNSIVATQDGEFEEVLSLSYTHLPHHLRPCFLYMGGFPEDYEIHVSKLIRLWVAEGFLETNVCERTEETAEEYFVDLVKRSLVLVTSWKSNGKIKTCSMHDLMRDLCIRKSHEAKFLLYTVDRDPLKVVSQSINNKGRGLVIDNSYLNSLVKNYGSNIRTIICFRSIANSLGPLGNLRFLRALDMVKTRSLLSLPPELFDELVLLRYLALDYAVSIPTAISNLSNLQSLIILSCSYLPLNIWKMPQLRHLVSSSVDVVKNQPETTSVLENLQTLFGLRNFICTKRILKKMPNLKKIGISYDEDAYGRDFHLENLVYLDQLENLEVRIYGVYYYHMKFNPVFPNSLKKLTMSGCRITWKEMTVVGSLPNLQVLKLRNSNFNDGKKWETTEGEFSQLKYLLIEKSQLEEWITESSHFPSLNCLLFHHCCWSKTYTQVHVSYK
ncbi:hypothetical protein ABFS83_06G146100 [Erythranthe nasuta]